MLTHTAYGYSCCLHLLELILEGDRTMKKTLLLAAALACSGTVAQEPINLQCFINGKSFTFLRLFPDRNEVVKEDQYTNFFRLLGHHTK